MKCVISVVVISVALKSVQSDDINAQNEIMDSNYSDDQMNYGKIDNIPRNGQLDNAYNPQPPAESWLDTAKNALSGPTGQIMVHMAKEMISRSTGNSQVLFSFDFLISIGEINVYCFIKRFSSTILQIKIQTFYNKHQIFDTILKFQSIPNSDFEFKLDEFVDFGIT